jgi:hypothetical protein
MAIGLAALLGLGGFTYVNYDEWFKYPALRGYVSSQMKDPASTKFRGERISSSGWLCGEMNAKNSYGAYIGFKRFMSTSPTNAYVDGMGYVGVEKQIGIYDKAKELRDSLDKEMKVLDNLKIVNDKRVTPIQFSKQEIENMVETADFNQRWGKSCN